MHDLFDTIQKVLTLPEYRISLGNEGLTRNMCISPLPLLRRLVVSGEDAQPSDAYHLSFAGLGIYLVYFDTGADLQLCRIPEHFMLVTLIRGKASFKEGAWCGCEKAGNVVLLETSNEVDVKCSESAVLLFVPLKQCIFRYAFEKLTGTSAPVKMQVNSSFVLEGSGLYPLLNYMTLLIINDNSLYHGLSVPLEVLLVHELVAHHISQHQKKSPLPPPVPTPVHRAERLMAQNLDKDISIKDLASLAGTTPRTLTHHFHKFRVKSPHNALRDMRLDRAREFLITGMITSVTQVALKFRFHHVGRFAAAYKKRFNELPSETLRRSMADEALKSKASLNLRE